MRPFVVLEGMLEYHSAILQCHEFEQDLAMPRIRTVACPTLSVRKGREDLQSVSTQLFSGLYETQRSIKTYNISN